MASDGREHADEKLRLYAEAGFDVVAITDHDTFAGTQSTGLRIIDGREMLVIQGVEVSRRHHFVSLFTDTAQFSARNSLELLQANYDQSDAIMFLAHPSRYNYSVNWYMDVFSRFSSDRLVGMEVINQGMRYNEGCILLWDELLTEKAPERAIWGISTDDAHRREHIGLSYMIFLVSANNQDAIIVALQSGHSFLTNRVVQGQLLPQVNYINVCNKALTIQIDAEYSNQIQWISRGDVVATGSQISVTELDLRAYVRFVITNSAGQIFSQPFLLS